MSKKLCSLSVDLDPLTAYYKIHGLGDPARRLRYTILRNALPRFEELFAEAGVHATIFVVGQELERSEQAVQILRRMADSGHELANHTHTHPYDLNYLPEQVIDAEVRWAHDTITRLVGPEYAPTGFRSPGYGINSRVIEVLCNHGYRYDSSMFPSPLYYGAKALVMAGMTLRGRHSRAVMGDPHNLRCPPDPYRPDVVRPWARGQAPLVELPVAVLPLSRIPAIGTLIATSPDWMRRLLLRGMARRPFFNLELHGIDLADAITDRIPTELAGRQPDLRVPFTNKRAIFLETIEALKSRYQFVTLAEAASRMQREGKL